MTDIMHHADVRMIEVADGLGFTLKALKFLLFENEKRTSVRWLNTLSIAMHGKLVRTLRASTRTHSDYLSHTLGPETFANYRTSSNAL